MSVDVHAPILAGHPAVQDNGEIYDKLDTPYLPDDGCEQVEAHQAMCRRMFAGG